MDTRRLANADSANNLRRRIKLANGEAPGQAGEAESAGPQRAPGAPKSSLGEFTLEEIEEDTPDEDSLFG